MQPESTPATAAAAPPPNTERALTIASAAAIALLLVLGGLALQGVLQQRSAGRTAQRGERSVQALTRMRAEVAEAEAALQRAAPTAQPEALPPYRLAKEATEAELSALRANLATDNEQFNQVVALSALLSQRFDALAATLQADRSKPDLPRTADASDDARLHQRVQALLDQMAQRAHEQASAAQSRSDAASTRALVGIILGGLLALGLIGFGVWRSERDRLLAGGAKGAEKTATERQRASDEALQRIFDGAGDALFLIDAEGRIARAGAACERLWGHPAASLPGRPFIELVHPEDRRKIEQALASAAAHGAELRCRCKHRDGHTLHVVWKTQAMGDNGHLLGLVRDVTELHAARADAQRLEADLQQTRSELALAQQRAAASARLRADFITHVGAGLRSSPVAIVSLADSLQQGLAGPLNAEQQRELGKLQDTARSLGARVNAALDLALAEGGQLVLAREAFDLQETVQRVADEASAMTAKRGLRFESQLADDLGYARGDALRVEQMLRALLEHQMRSAGVGVVRLKASSPVAGVIKIVVGSDGPTPSADEAAAWFEPLRPGGSGLVLALARQLTTMMGGTLVAGSGAGSGFTLSLPSDEMRQA